MSLKIIDLIEKHGIISPMIAKPQMELILSFLVKTIENNVDGDIVELGCNVGTTSIYITRILDQLNSKKKYHVYDSFEGLPDRKEEDECESKQYQRGYCKTTKDEFEKNYLDANLKLPIVNTGWFKDIDDSKYPEKISFAFFDGDFYSSILDSFNKCGNKLSPNSITIVHDFEDPRLPGVKKACDEWFGKNPHFIFTKIQKLLICRKIP